MKSGGKTNRQMTRCLRSETHTQKNCIRSEMEGHNSIFPSMMIKTQMLEQTQFQRIPDGIVLRILQITTQFMFIRFIWPYPII